jgi:ferricrocin synthase
VSRGPSAPVCLIMLYLPADRFLGPVSPERLGASWRSLRLRHSILRTSFVVTATGETLQAVIKDVPLNDPTYSLVQAEGPLEDAVLREVQREAALSSDMFTVPVRARHVKAADGDAFALVIHHALYGAFSSTNGYSSNVADPSSSPSDGWSLPLLIADLCALYAGQPCASAPDFTRFVQTTSARASAVDDDDRRFWARALGAPTPCLLPNTANSSSAFVLVRGAVARAADLAVRARAAQVALPALVLACVARLVGELGATADPVVGLVRAGRAGMGVDVDVDVDVERVAGPTVNVVPLRVRDAPTVRETAVRVQREVSAMVGARERVGLGEALEAAGWARARGPLFNVFVNLLWHGERTREAENGLLERWEVSPRLRAFCCAGVDVACFGRSGDRPTLCVMERQLGGRRWTRWTAGICLRCVSLRVVCVAGRS